MIITKTPFRISFAGGGTDIKEFYEVHGGAVVSAAINKYFYVIVNEMFDDGIKVSYSRNEQVSSPEEVRNEIVRACLEETGVSNHVEIHMVADIPGGVGLGSQSALTVGLLNALYTYRGEQLSAEQLASKACEIEIERLGLPIGKQDQYAAAYGGLNFFEFLVDGSVTRERIELPGAHYKKSDRCLLMFYTGTARDSLQVMNQQVQQTKSRTETLLAMKQQAYSLREELVSTGFGPSVASALSVGWGLKRTIADSMTSPRVDAWYEAAMKAGASGGKLLGAGGRDFLLFYCDEKHQDAVREALGGMRELDFRFSPYGSRVVYFA
jgi:D-glycero-alpha-D-manno-heptose-7-phosphate kinase